MRNRPTERSFRLRPGLMATTEERIMGKGLILWMLGVPGIIVILLLVTHVL